MKRLLLILLLWHGLYEAHAQQYFYKRYSLNAFATALSSIIPLNGKYYCTGMAVDSSDSSFSTIGVKFCILDSVGNILKDTIFQRPGIRNYYAEYNNSLYPMPDNNGFILGVSQDYDPTTNLMYALLIRYDSIGNILWTREYDKPFCADTMHYYTIADLKPTGTGEWLMLTTIQCPDSPALQVDFVLTKLDSNFYEEWNKEYDYPNLRNDACKIVVENNGYLLGGGVTNDFSIAMTGVRWQALMIKTDTSGNEQWQWKSDSTKLTFDIQDIIHCKDKGYVYCSFGNGYEQDIVGRGYLNFKGWIEKLDSNRNVVWNDTFSTEYTDISTVALSVLKELPDSSIVVAGNLLGGFNPIDTVILFDYTCLVKFRPNGDVVWKRKYKYKDSLWSYTYDMKQTSDDGFLLCGESDDPNNYYGNTTQQAWVLKVDSNGCMGPTDPQCLTEGVPQVHSNIAVKVYPNPAKDFLTIASASVADHEEVAITDAIGQTLLTQRITSTKERIDIKAWAPGVYLYYVAASGSPLQTGKIIKY